MRSGIKHRVDDLGRIVIPKELRRQVGIDYGDLCDVSIGENGSIIIQKLSGIRDVSGEINRIKDAVMEETAEDIREEVFQHLNSVEKLIKTISE